jgi:ABC-type uncharacterized transport system auxiliary subunit
LNLTRTEVPGLENSMFNLNLFRISKIDIRIYKGVLLVGKILKTIAYLIFISFIMSCGGVPPTYYYRIHYDLPEHNSPTPIPVTIGIEPFDADVPYKGDRIVYRNSDYEVKFYHYRRWIAPPTKIVQEAVLEQFQSSGNFQKVVDFHSQVKSDYILKGDIKAFEEWDVDDSWYGFVSIAFELHDEETSEIIWQNVISEKTQVSNKEPVEVVKAISESLKKVLENALRDIAQNLKS